MHRIVTGSLTLGLILLVASRASATVTPAALWRLGEQDLGASPNDPCLPFTMAAAGGSDLARQGTLEVNNAYYTDALSPAAASRGSSLGMRFDNTIPPNPVRYFSPNDPCLGCTDNFGVEMWVRSGGAQPDEGFGVVAYGLGSAGVDTYTVGQAGDSWFASVHVSPTLAYEVGSVPVYCVIKGVV